MSGFYNTIHVQSPFDLEKIPFQFPFYPLRNAVLLPNLKNFTPLPFGTLPPCPRSPYPPRRPTRPAPPWAGTCHAQRTRGSSGSSTSGWRRSRKWRSQRLVSQEHTEKKERQCWHASCNKKAAYQFCKVKS